MAANSGSSDIVNTSTVAGRNAPELENLMGERCSLTYLLLVLRLLQCCIVHYTLSPFCLECASALSYLALSVALHCVLMQAPRCRVLHHPGRAAMQCWRCALSPHAPTS